MHERRSCDTWWNIRTELVVYRNTALAALSSLAALHALTFRVRVRVKVMITNAVTIRLVCYYTKRRRFWHVGPLNGIH